MYCKLDGEYEGRRGWDPPPPPLPPFVYLRHLCTLFGVYCQLDGERGGRGGGDLLCHSLHGELVGTILATLIFRLPLRN